MAGTVRSRQKTSPIPKGLRPLCRRLGITRYVPIALRLLEECFPRMRELHMYPECDPESGEEWLVLQIRVPGTYEDVQRQYRHFNDRRAKVFPPRHVASIRLMHLPV
jgi:hypothetical protein